jgi:hypothetical protein
MADFAGSANSGSSSHPGRQHLSAQEPAAPGVCYPALRTLSLSLPDKAVFTTTNAPAVKPPLPKLSHYSLSHHMAFSEPSRVCVTARLQHSMHLQHPQQQVDDTAGSSADATGGAAHQQQQQQQQQQASGAAGSGVSQASTWVPHCHATVAATRTRSDHDAQQVGAAWQRALRQLASCSTSALQLDLRLHRDHLASQQLVQGLAQQLPGLTRLDLLAQVHGCFGPEQVGPGTRGTLP